MRPGPPPTPPELKLVRGNPGHRPIPKGRVNPKLGARCPEWLSPGAKAHWGRLAPTLERLKLLTEIDWPALAALCHALQDLEWAEKDIMRRGRTQVGVGGTAIARPAVMIARQAREHVRKLSTEFGLTPATRSRAALADDEKPNNPDDRFFGPRPAPAPPAPTRDRGRRPKA